MRRASWALCVIPLSLVSFAQTVTLIPTCGKPGDKVCISGASWAEPNPVCRYTFAFDGTKVANDQPDGLYGPPSTNFFVPAAAADGNHTVHVELRLNSPDKLLQQKDAIFKVLAAGAKSSVTTGGSGTGSITITYKSPDACESSCKRITFVQVVRRFVVKTDGTEVITKATDWNIADPVKKASVETDPARRRVDNFWGVKSPYYPTNSAGALPAVGGDFGYGQTGSTEPARVDASLKDGPSMNLANFNGGFAIQEAILRFESAPLCIEGNDAGKYLGWVVTWEAHKTATMGPTVSNITITQGQPNADFLKAVDNWINAADHKFSLPKAPVAACIY